MNKPKVGGFVALEGIKHGNKFLCLYTEGYDYTTSKDGETWYRILGYADTHEEAVRILYSTKLDENNAMKEYFKNGFTF